MHVILSLLWALILSLFSLSVFAWEVTLQADDSTQKVMVSNEANLNGVDVYLVVFDKDAKDEQPLFQSWIVDQGWQMGLKPVSSSAIDLTAFASREMTALTPTCPDEHRCVLALVAIEHGLEPLENQNKWQAASFLPLTLSAGCERWPGQTFFLSCDSSRGGYAEGAVDLAVDDGAAAPAANKAAAPEAAAGSAAPDTEKPDIFRRVGDKLLYANGQAKRFQVIDIADVSNPVLTAWTALSGYPRELYVLGEHYVLLQTDYVGEEGTHLTVLRENEAGKLITVDEMTLSGHFIESRRRNDLIYSVTQDYTTVEDDQTACVGCRISKQSLNIKALRLTEAGKWEEADQAELAGYSPTIAIFPNHLVIANHNPEEEKWRTTQIQVFDLSQSDPLVELPTLKVPGRVPSEFHLSIVDDQFRVVYGPEDRKDGSSLAIYKLPKMSLIGKVDKIAPGEELFATRFVGDRAFVVTFERTDPLWVIDLSEPNKPKIMGELEVPGWSEKLFFHEDRLFAVGINDQPLESEEARWVRRVALSLFDVADPTKPSLLSSLTPLAGVVNYSWSPALDDERALLLNWEDAFAALPINSWESDAGNHLQIVSLANDKLEDAGRLDSTVQIQRSVSLKPDVLAALGDQALITLRWGQGETKKLGELELATNLTWLDLQGDVLLSAASGNQGYHRFYRYAKTDVETPIKRWHLPRGYDGVDLDGDLVVFYDYNPLAVQVLDLKTGELKKAQVLEKQAESETPDSPEAKPLIAPVMWYNRSQPLWHKGQFYVAEQRQFQGNETQATVLPRPDQNQWQVQWLLRSWDMQVEEAKEAPTRSIPGQPLGFSASGELITQEVTEQGQLRLNLSKLDAEQARLLQSRELPCQAYSQVIWADEAVYVICQNEERYIRPEPIILEDTVADKEGETDTLLEDEDTADEKEAKTDTPESENQEPTTQLLKLNPGQGFTSEGQWTLTGSRRLEAIRSDIVLMGPG
ncbi:MAG TPA: hypothetical protein EYP59_14020, partial [Thiotrichaceae bacterium]|nr:hypothetical protein [Thiotrichaceae bacterium]